MLCRVVEADTKLKQQSRAAGGASASSRTSRGVPFTHQMTAAEATAAFLESQKRQQGQTRPAAPSKPPTKTRTGISANGGTDGGASSTPARLRPLGGRGQAIAAILEGRLGRAAASTATAAAATTTGCTGTKTTAPLNSSSAFGAGGISTGAGGGGGVWDMRYIRPLPEGLPQLARVFLAASRRQGLALPLPGAIAAYVAAAGRRGGLDMRGWALADVLDVAAYVTHGQVGWWKVGHGA